MNKPVIGAPHKRAVNLAIDPSLLAEAKANGVNLSRVLERALLSERAKRWLVENAGAIEAYNARIERDGAWSDGWRGW